MRDRCDRKGKIEWQPPCIRIGLSGFMKTILQKSVLIGTCVLHVRNSYARIYFTCKLASIAFFLKFAKTTSYISKKELLIAPLTPSERKMITKSSSLFSIKSKEKNLLRLSTGRMFQVLKKNRFLRYPSSLLRAYINFDGLQSAMISLNTG